MTDFFTALASDLRDRRFLPILVLLGVALIAALAFAVLGGGSSSSSAPTPSAASPRPATRIGAVTITKAPETASSQAVAETTSPNGSPHGSGAPRNPFKPLSSPVGASSSSKGSGGTSSSSSSGNQGGTSSGGSHASNTSTSSSSGSGGSTSGSGGSKPTVTVKSTVPPKPAPPKPIYVVSVVNGFAPSPGQPANLTDVPDVKVGEKLPSASDPRLVFEGVNKNATGAIFKLLAPAILHGPAGCMPSPENCESIVLPIKKAEELEYAEADGQTVAYAIEVVNISKVTIKAGAARAHAAGNGHKRHGHRHRSK